MTNEEIIREGYAMFNRGDWKDVASFFAQDAVIDGSVAFVGPVSYRGPEGAQNLMDEIEQLFDDFHTDPIEYVTSGESVLCVVDQSGRLKVSGRKVQDRELQLWTLRDGQVIGLRVFRDRDAAENAMSALESG